MKLPFFKAQKPEPKPTMSVFVPQRVPQPKPATSTAPSGPVPIVDNALTVPIHLKSILAQVPRGLLMTQDTAQLASITFAVPASLVTAQLSTGKVVLSLSQVADLLPQELVNKAVLANSGHHAILLPLSEVIAVIPPEALAVKPEREISLDTPELARLPGLFEPTAPKLTAEPQAATAPIRVTPVPTSSSSRPFRPLTDAAATVAIPVPTPPPPPPPKKPVAPVRVAALEPPPEPAVQLPVDIEIPEHLHLTVRGLIAGLPDELFVCPKVDLGQRTDLEMTVEVPVEPMLPQLQKGRITLPLGNVIDLLPRAILCQPLPATDVANVPLPLHEIVAQLPPELFTAQLSSTRPDEFEAVETEIPMPFQERAPRVTVRPPAPPVAPPVEEAPEEVSVEDLEHEEIPIFAEKQPATAPVAPAAPPAPEPLPEPVAPPPPVVAEVVPVAAAPEPILPMEEPPAPPTPVVEPVVPALVAEEDAGVIDEKKFLIDLNRCSVEDLVRIPGVGRTLAQRVIDFRNNRGQFTSLDELRLIPGIGRKTFRALTGAEPRSLNRLLGVDDARELTLQEIVKLTNSLPGIEGSMLAMSDGLFLAGQLPAELDQEAISVFAPQLFKRVGRYVKELKVGHVRRFTIFTELRPISIFHAGDVYLVIIHDTRHFSKKLLRQCERISQEIARLCRQRTIV